MIQGMPTQAPTTAAPSVTPSRAPTHAPSGSPTMEPTKNVDETVRGNEFVLYFSSRRTLQQPGDRALQQPENCLDKAQRKFAQTRLRNHTDNAYANSLGLATVSFFRITLKNYIDMSPADDCTEIKFIFDQGIIFNIGGNDETTITELIQLPLASEANRQAFVQDLIDESSTNGIFSRVTGVGEIVVTEEGLSTRTPTSSPSISTSPTESPSYLPSL